MPETEATITNLPPCYYSFKLKPQDSPIKKVIVKLSPAATNLTWLALKLICNYGVIYENKNTGCKNYDCTVYNNSENDNSQSVEGKKSFTEILPDEDDSARVGRSGDPLKSKVK